MAHGDGDSANDSGDSARQFVGKRIDVLDVSHRDHECVSWEVRIPVQTDAHQHMLITPGRELALRPGRGRTEGAVVIGRRVGTQLEWPMNLSC